MSAVHRTYLAYACVLFSACAGDPMGAHASKTGKAADGGGSKGDEPEQRPAPMGNRGTSERCQLESKPPSGRLQIKVSGTEREYELVLPDSYDGSKRFPVLFAWHGTSSSGLEFIEPYYGAIVDGVAGRAVIVAPDGLIEDEGEWAGMTRWQLSSIDGEFFDVLLDKLNRDYCIDPQRVFATGHSIGGYFTNYLGCTRGSRLRAIAPVAGGGPLTASDCVGHPAVMIGHNPAECAEVTSPNCPFAVPWADTGWLSAQFWASRNGCADPGPMPTEPYDDKPPCRPLTGCDPLSPVTLCLYDYESVFAGPHAWPTPWMAGAIMDAFLSLPAE